MDSDLKRFEEELERLSPGNLPEGLISRMEAAMESWEEVGNEADETGGEGAGKVVPFPGRDEAAGGGSSSRGIWAAAASVALLGGLGGLIVTANPDKDEVATRAPLAARENVQAVEFSPQVARRKILGASDGRVVIANGGQALQVLRVEYVDRVVFRNADGEEVHVEVPAVNYRLVPVVTD